MPWTPGVPVGRSGFATSQTSVDGVGISTDLDETLLGGGATPSAIEIAKGSCDGPFGLSALSDEA